MHSIFACVNVWIHYIFRGGHVDNLKGNMGNFIPYTPSPSRHMEPCLILTPVTTSVTLFQISPQCPTSRCSSLLAAAALSEPPSVTELPSVGGGVQYQLYSCTVVQCTVATLCSCLLTAHCSPELGW